MKQADGQGTYGADVRERVGFFTDTSICIGCKACEVACKEWNMVPEDGLNWTGNSFDNTVELNANSWRHVAFVEQRRDLGTPQEAHVDTNGRGPMDFRWLMESDVCKHCTHAGCLDACPTGAITRTEFGTVVIQDDVCNGCGYCITACPFGVISLREIEGDGGAHKCTLCYDRIGDGLEPACAKACPTKSIQYGPLEELRANATGRLAQLHADGVGDARLYLASDDDGIGGAGAFFLLLDEPDVYGLPPDPVVPTRDIGTIWNAAATAAVALLTTAAVAVLTGRRS
jgi:formate dehydrogenase iron-sulfur subunit